MCPVCLDINLIKILQLVTKQQLFRRFPPGMYPPHMRGGPPHPFMRGPPMMGPPHMGPPHMMRGPNGPPQMRPRNVKPATNVLPILQQLKAGQLHPEHHKWMNNKKSSNKFVFLISCKFLLRSVVGLFIYYIYTLIFVKISSRFVY